MSYNQAEEDIMDYTSNIERQQLLIDQLTKQRDEAFLERDEALKQMKTIERKGCVQCDPLRTRSRELKMVLLTAETKYEELYEEVKKYLNDEEIEKNKGQLKMVNDLAKDPNFKCAAVRKFNEKFNVYKTSRKICSLLFDSIITRCFLCECTYKRTIPDTTVLLSLYPDFIKLVQDIFVSINETLDAGKVDKFISSVVTDRFKRYKSEPAVVEEIIVEFS